MSPNATFTPQTIYQLGKALFDLPIHTIDESGKISLQTSPQKSPPRFCQVIRKEASLHQKCLECDKFHQQDVQRQNKSKNYLCHFGFVDVISPIKVSSENNSSQKTSLITGGLLPVKHSKKHFSRLLGKISGSLTEIELWELYLKMPYWPSEKIQAFQETLELYALRLSDQPNPSPQQERLEIHQIKQFFSQHFDSEIYFDALAKKLGFSTSYLSSLFKKETGTSLVDYLLNFRLEKAAKLLKQSTQPIDVVSRQCGFPSQTYFNRVFQNKYGCAPSVYRRN